MLKQDTDYLAAENLHQLQRAWELNHRIWTAEAVLRHTLFRTETRWPGYIYRSDYPKLDDENWHVFVNSKYNPSSGEWAVFKKPIVGVLP
jgi:adenylylsulfate reductase subunit A